MSLNSTELKEIEKQLGCPTGENGIKIANNMHQSNISMTMASIELLNLKANDHLLEIGHGNASHLKQILERTDGLKYTGLEISKTMQKEAKRINAGCNADFLIYDGNNIPFEKSSFNKIVSVNTIYFWKDAIGFIKEVQRVLKSDGMFILTFALKSFMQQLPFVKSEFKLYDELDLRKLISYSKLKIDSLVHKNEMVQSKSGELVNRSYIVAQIKK